MEIAHAHVDMGLVCISRGRLESMGLGEIKETATHEVSHMIYADHGTEFHRTKNKSSLMIWHQSHEPPVLSEEDLRKIALRKPKGTCNELSCKRRGKLKTCEYCKRFFCETHAKPRMALILNQVNREKEPMRSKLEKEYRRGDGHPDYQFTQFRWQRLEDEETETNEIFDTFLDKSKKIDYRSKPSNNRRSWESPVPKRWSWKMLFKQATLVLAATAIYIAISSGSWMPNEREPQTTLLFNTTRSPTCDQAGLTLTSVVYNEQNNSFVVTVANIGILDLANFWIKGFDPIGSYAVLTPPDSDVILVPGDTRDFVLQGPFVLQPIIQLQAMNQQCPQIVSNVCTYSGTVYSC
ncbi:MAG: hypothetical protein HY366_00705 [Candidatus Aenigmarchaeota archaeon]|nr:hypothetical protein [Candidatus Aenigmarchaeota archaeon]